MSESDISTWEADDHYCVGDWCQHKFVDGEIVYVKSHAFADGEVWFGVYCKKHAPEDSTPYRIKLLDIPTSGGTEA